MLWYYYTRIELLKPKEKKAKMADLTHIPVVDVDNTNLKATWPSLIMAVKNATFVAIDCELSGLGERRKLNARSVEDRYLAICAVARTRAIVSLGVSCYLYQPQGNEEPKKQGYIVQTFNILLFCNESFVSDPVSLRFLVQHGFDFNRQFSEGITYYRGQDKGEMDFITDPMRQLFSQLVVCGHPVIVHNGLVDLIFLYHSFYVPLPQTLPTFIADLEEIFSGGVFDTKYITEFKARYPASFLEYCFRRCQRDNSIAACGQASHVEAIFLRYPDTSRVTYMNGLSKASSPKILQEEVCTMYANFGFCNAGNNCKSSHDVELVLDQEEASMLKKRDKRKRKRKREKERQQLAIDGKVVQAGDDNHDKQDDMDCDINDDETNSKDSDVDDEEINQELSDVKVSENHSQLDVPRDSISCETSGDTDMIHIDPSTAALDPGTSKPGTTGGHRAGYDAFMTGYIFAHFISRYGVTTNLPSSPTFSDFKLDCFRGKLALSGKDVPLQLMKSSFSKTSKEHRQKLQKLKGMRQT